MANFWREEKILSLENAVRQAEYFRTLGKTLVTVNGSFDVLHGGHISILEEAKQQGDFLFVGLNSDKAIRDGKGFPFPIIPEDQRSAVLASLICVDFIVVIDAPYGTTHDVLLEKIRPNIHVNCDEFGPVEQWAEYSTMQRYGIQGHVVRQMPGVSDEQLRSGQA